MRVLWFSITPSLYSDQLAGGWVASLEQIIRDNCPEVDLGISFELKDPNFKVVKNGVTYYPICRERSLKEKIFWRLDPRNIWDILRPQALKVIDDYKPDVIHCFGSEWPFGLIVKDVDIPVVIHMQGFNNIYRLSATYTYHSFDLYKYYKFNPFKIIQHIFQEYKSQLSDRIESEIMACNKNFMGRTEWDKNIVKYFSPNANYYYCPEAIRPVIKNAKKSWAYKERSKMKLITISSASALKGNGLIMQTARILKDKFNFDFEWRVAGNRTTFDKYESMSGYKHEDYNITLLGYIDADTIVNELCDADAYVHTAIIDNSPNSLCEAQLLGCPVISTNVGGIPQLVDDGESGILYPYNEPYALAFHIMNLYQNKKKLEYLSKNEITQSHARHDEKVVADTLLEIYKDMLK